MKVCYAAKENPSGSYEKYGRQYAILPEQAVNGGYWQTVYWHFRKWTLEGVIELAYQCIRKALRKKRGKKQSASVGIIDRASVRMSSISGQSRGIDGNKKIKGSKRHIIVDTMRLIICIAAHAANIHDSKGAKQVFEKLYDIRHDEERMEKIFTDSGYPGELKDWLKQKLSLVMEVVKRNESDPFN